MVKNINTHFLSPKKLIFKVLVNENFSTLLDFFVLFFFWIFGMSGS